MRQRINTNDYLKTRHFIELDQLDAKQKIKSFNEKPKRRWQQKLIEIKQQFQRNRRK